MDELFQKAAEEYPLKTSTGNFDKVLPFVEMPTNIQTNNRFPILLWSLLMIMAIAGGSIFIHQLNSKKSDNNKFYPASKSANSKQINNTLNNTSSNGFVTKLSNTSNKTLSNTFNKSAQIISEEKESKKINRLKNKNQVVQNNLEKMKASIEYIQPTKNEISFDGMDIKRKKMNAINLNIEDYLKTTEKTTLNNKDQFFASETTHDQPIEIKPIQSKTIATAEKEALKKNIQLNKKNNLSVYYGLTAGVELNEVKNQPMKKPSYNFGFALGLQLNHQIAIESGLVLSQKKYFSEGKYFTPKPGIMPSDMIVNSLNGSCTIIELPLVIKYNLSKKSNTIFGKVGLSSYLLTKESNQYQAIVNGQKVEVNSTYKDATFYSTSNINLSLGYQHNIGKQLNFRVEPYVQIPIKGVGIGSLPVTTIGVRIGILHFNK